MEAKCTRRAFSGFSDSRAFGCFRSLRFIGFRAFMFVQGFRVSTLTTWAIRERRLSSMCAFCHRVG